MSIPSNGFHVDAEGLIVLGLALVVAAVALPSILLSTIDTWQRFRRERDFQRLLQATLTDLKRTSSSAEGGLGIREEDTYREQAGHPRMIFYPPLDLGQRTR